MNIEKFASRGLKAQQAVDKILSPAAILAGGSPSPGAGRTNNTAPRSCGGPPTGVATPGGAQRKDMLARVETSSDATWLKTVMNGQDYTVGIRAAAQRRLGKLFRKPKL